MKKMVFIVLMVTAGFSLHATEVKPQAGIESYFGPNGMRLVTPWLGLRLGLSPKTSLLLKYYNHNIRFKYIDNEENEVQRKATLSNLTGAIYVMLGRHHAYGALSLFRGTDGFDASAFDGGVGLKMTNRLTLEIGTYLTDESSVLWYPEESERNIRLYSLKTGLKYQITPWLALNPRLHLYRNSDDVEAATYAFGILIAPRYPIYLSLVYLHYPESALYQFKGDYLSLGLNFYY